MPKVSHLQAVVLECLGTQQRSGRDLRRTLAQHSIRKSGPAFYQLMARLEEAGFVEGAYSLKATHGEVIKERTIAGLQAARARGRLGGRPKLQSLDPKKVALARKLYDDGHMTVQEICDTLHIGRSTLYRYVGEQTDKVGARRER